MINDGKVKNYKIIEHEWDGDYLKIKVCLNNNNKINLKFREFIVEDHFLNSHPFNVELSKATLIKILSDNSNELLNLIVSKALDDKDVMQQLKDGEVGQFTVKPEHFGFKDYRKKIK